MLGFEDEFTIIDDFPVTSGSLSSLPSTSNPGIILAAQVHSQQRFFMLKLDKQSLNDSFQTDRLANYGFAGAGHGIGPSMINIFMLSMGVEYVFNARQEVLGFRYGNCFFTCTQDLNFSGAAVFPATFAGLHTNILPSHGPGVPSEIFWDEIKWMLVPTANEATPRSHVALMIGVRQAKATYSFHLYDSKNYSWGTSGSMQRALTNLQTKLSIRCIDGGKSLLGKQQMFAYRHGWAIDRKCALHVFALAYFFSRMNKRRLTPTIVDDVGKMIFEIINGLPDHVLPVVMQLGYREDDLTKPENDHLRLKYLSALKVMNQLLDYTASEGSSMGSTYTAVQNTAKVLVPLMQRLIKYPYAYLMLVFLYAHMISNTDPNGQRAKHVREFLAACTTI